MILNPGDIIHNRYRIVRLIAKGGFGTIHRAWDLNLQRPCALKINLDISPAAQKQFQREAVLLAKLNHPHLARVTDYFTIPEMGQFLIMDFVEGEDLQQIIDRDGAISEKQALNWIEQVSEALAYIHTRHPAIIHRDIKPANIKITSEGKAVLVDFGIAKVYDPALKTTLGARAITPGYSPIEQYGAGTTDARSDIYALGATLYCLLTATVPPESISRHSGLPLVPPRAICPGISATSEAAILKAMELSPNARFQNIQAFSAALQGSFFIQRSVSPQIFPDTIQPPQVKEQPKQPNRSKLFGCIGLLGLFVILASLFIFLIFPKIQSPFPPYVSSPSSTATVQSAHTSPPPTQASTLVISPSPEYSGVTELPSQPSTTPSPTHKSTNTPTITPSTTFTAIPLFGGGGLIAFNSNRNGNNDIYVVDSISREITQLTFGSSDDRVPFWSPDGKQIAYQSNADGDWEIFTLNLSSGVTQQVTTNDCNDFAPNWSPDGKRFTFYSDCDGNREIYIMDIDGDNRSQLTETVSIYNWFPTWSPDGNQITYSSNLSGEYRIYVINADGTSPHPLHPGCISSFSPDGQSIIFTTYCSDSGDIWIMNRDGSNVRKLSDYDNNTNPAWSRDGTKIVFQSDRSGNDEIWVMNLDGSDWVQLTDHPARDRAPVWQPQN